MANIGNENSSTVFDRSERIFIVAGRIKRDQSDLMSTWSNEKKNAKEKLTSLTEASGSSLSRVGSSGIKAIWCQLDPIKRKNAKEKLTYLTKADLYGRRSDWVGWRSSNPLPSWSNKKSPTNRPSVNVLAARPLSIKLNQNGLSLTNFLSRKTVQAESWTLCTRLYPLYISTKDCIRWTLLMWSEDTKDTNSQVDELCDQCNYEASHGEHLRMHLDESNAVKWIFCWKFYRTLSQSVVQILSLNYLNSLCKFYLSISIISIRGADDFTPGQQLVR